MAPPAKRAEEQKKKKKSAGKASGVQSSGAGAGALKPKPGGINKIRKYSFHYSDAFRS
jgi:hypothetical protein